MVGNGDAALFAEDPFVSGSDDTQAKEEPAEGCQDVTEQDDRESEEMEPKVEIDEFVGPCEIDFLRVSLYLVDLLLRDFWPFLHLHS
jgi:hypothetical protein